MVHCLSLLCLSGHRRLCVAVRAVWSIVSLYCVSVVIGGFVWSIVSLYCVSLVIGGFVWQCKQCGPLSLSIVSQWSYAALCGSVVHCLSLLCLSGHRRLCVAVRAVWSIVSLYCVSVVIGGFVWQCEQCGPLSLSIVSQWSYAALCGSVVHCLSLLCLSGHRRLCVAVRAVWSIVSLYCVSVVIGGFVWWCEQCGPLSLSIVSQWS